MHARARQFTQEHASARQYTPEHFNALQSKPEFIINKFIEQIINKKF
jgi:hypothetical protein